MEKEITWFKILFIVGDWAGFDENLIFYLSIERFLES